MEIKLNNKMEKDTNKKYMFYKLDTKIYNDTPIFTEVNYKDYVKYGEDNQYTSFLLNLFQHSVLHRSLLKKKIMMISGMGFEKTDDEILNNIINNTFSKETLEDILEANSTDLMLFGGFGVIITWSKDKQTISRLKSISPHNFRIVKQLTFDESKINDINKKIYDAQQKDVDYYYISSDWSNLRKKENKLQLIQGFSEILKDELTQLLYFKIKEPGIQFYTLPSYIGGLKSIMTDVDISNYHLNSLQNSFNPGMIIQLKEGKPTDEDADIIMEKLGNDFKGSTNAQSPFVTFSNSPETTPEIITLEGNNSHERYLQLKESVQENIMLAHQGNPAIAGIVKESSLGSSQQIFENEYVFQSNVITPLQLLIEDVYNKFGKINGSINQLKIQKVSTFDDDFINVWIKPESKLSKEKLILREEIKNILNNGHEKGINK